IEDVPVSSVIAGGELVAAIPDNANRARHWPGGHPRKYRSRRFGAIADANRIAPGVAFIDRISDVDILVIRIAGIDRAISRNLDGEKELGIAVARNVGRGLSDLRPGGSGRNCY